MQVRTSNAGAEGVPAAFLGFDDFDGRPLLIGLLRLGGLGAHWAAG